MRLLSLALIVCAFVALRANAQAQGPWLIIPVSAKGDESSLEVAAAKVRSELAERGIDVWSLDSAATRFEAEGSAPAAKVSEDDIQRWAARSNEAIRSLVRGDYAAALEQLDQAQRLSRAAAEELNRERERSRQVLDTCLYLVRALLETGSNSRANATVHECRQLVPRGEASAGMHPPEVLQLLERIDESHAHETGSLRVSSEPSACSVRVNGVMLGETPFKMRDLLPGPYRVQVECDPEQRGRVHTAEVIAGPTDVFVDVRFDRLVETDPILHLRYSSMSELRQHRVVDAQKIAAAVPASRLLLMFARAPDTMDLELYEGAPLAVSALARIPTGPEGPSRGDVALAARTLAQERCTDFTGREPVTVPCVEPEPEAAENIDDWPSDRRPRGQFISGLTLAGVGSASLLTGYVLMVPLAKAAEDWVSGIDSTGVSDGSAQEKWSNTGVGIIATSSVGAAALVAAMPLALPERSKTPWWAWLAGGLGVGAAVGSGYVGSTVSNQGDTVTSCSSSDVTGADARICVRRAERTSLAVLLGVSAAPLLTMPLVYLIRPKETKVTPSVHVSRSGGSVSFRGEF